MFYAYNAVIHLTNTVNSFNCMLSSAIHCWTVTQILEIKPRSQALSPLHPSVVGRKISPNDKGKQWRESLGMRLVIKPTWNSNSSGKNFSYIARSSRGLACLFWSGTLFPGFTGLFPPSSGSSWLALLVLMSSSSSSDSTSVDSPKFSSSSYLLLVWKKTI